MKILGIIAEYNPIHNGHAYQIQEAKKRSGADYCIIALSGNFLQRGEAACLDKFIRTKCALLSGADLVFELPVPFATATAPVFAKNGVLLLHKTGIVNHLSFGCENDNLEGLQFLASFFEKEPEGYKKLLKEKLKAGFAYPSARKSAFLDFCKYCPDKISNAGGHTAAALSALLDSPNNILAISYLRAIQNLALNIQPIPIKRMGGQYHESTLSSDFSSAQAIRSTLFSEGPTGKLLSAIPEGSRSIFTKAWEQKAFVTTDAFSSQLYYKLLSLSGDYEQYAEISPELARRIEKHLSAFTTFSEFAKLLMRKNETYSTISRGLVHILLDIKKEEVSSPKYLRVLGMRKEASFLLREIKKKGSLPILTKAANAPSLLSSKALHQLEKDFFSESVYHSAFLSSGCKGYHPYLQNPVLL